MQGLLALAWLSPKDPNLLDNTFGKFASREYHYDNQIDIALWLMGIFLIALAWRVLRDRANWFKSVAPKLDEKLAEERTRTWVERVVTAALVFIALLA